MTTEFLRRLRLDLVNQLHFDLLSTYLLHKKGKEIPMIKKQNDALAWLEFEIFQEFKRLKHGVFLRHGGVSLPPFDSLNFGLSQGDSKESVKENIQRSLKNLQLEKAYSAFQVHGTEVKKVTSKWNSDKECDGLYTQEKGCALLIKHADCQAALIYDPIQDVVANIHCGWRGNVQNIYAKAIEKLKSDCGSLPENLFVGISPSLGPYSFEFLSFEKDLPKAFWPFQVRPYFFDFWQISRWQLEECGVLPHHIQCAEICTYSNPQDFFSYRREKCSGRSGSFIGLTMQAY